MKLSHFKKNSKKYLRRAARVFAVTVLVLLFNNCGSGIKPSSQINDQSSSTSPAASPTLSPKPSPGPTKFSPGIGWTQIPNTTIDSVCAVSTYPQVSGSDTRCYGVVNAWSSAAFDTSRNQLLVMGGGHDDYFGNEVYSISLGDTQTNPNISRFTNPGLPPAPGSCSGGADCTTDRGQMTSNNNTSSECMESVANGTQPNTRHTYDGVTYIEGFDQVFIFGGSLACMSGNFSSLPWTLDIKTKTWQRVVMDSNTASQINANAGQSSVYNSKTGKVIIYDLQSLWSYDPSTRIMSKFTGAVDYDAKLGDHKAAVIDTKRNKFVLMGDGAIYIADLNNGLAASLSAVSTSGDSSIINTIYPGLAYDPNLDRIVAWNGGNQVYILNLDTLAWTVQTVAGGPAASVGGTNKRFNYVPSLKGFIDVNNDTANAYFLRLY